MHRYWFCSKLTTMYSPLMKGNTVDNPLITRDGGEYCGYREYPYSPLMEGNTVDDLTT